MVYHAVLDQTEPKKRYGHVAVCVEHYVLVIGGVYLNWQAFGYRVTCQPFCHSVIWSYNLYTEKWRRYVIPRNKIIPSATKGHVV